MTASKLVTQDEAAVPVPVPARRHAWVRNVVYTTTDIDIANNIMILVDQTRIEVGSAFCYVCGADWSRTPGPCVVVIAEPDPE